MRLALLSNVTTDLLANMIRKNNEVYLSAGFNTWQQDVLIPTSGLYAFKPEAIVILLHANAYEWKDKESGYQQIDEWCDVFRILVSNLPRVPIFVSSIDISVKVHYGSEQRYESFIENYLIMRIEELHQSGESIYILPVKETIADLGKNTFYSDKMWYVGSMPYSMKGLSALTDLICRYCSVTKGMQKKIIAVDLDNTLWGGVIGEDGVEGISLSSHKEGARYFDAQKILKKMKTQGVMLAILSKNNVEDVEMAFNHPNMVLKHEDFVAEAINWEPKSVNIRHLAKALNIGLDSFVFLDDNPAECEQMKAECPEVSVIDFPKDSSLLPKTIENAYNEFFLSLEVTGEDIEKTAMYRAENQRKAEMSSATSIEEYLKKLEMTMSIHKMIPEEVTRVVQLTNKTNQFNVTTKRYSMEEINDLAESGDIITVHMGDKFGDQGLVAIMILKYERDEAIIDSFLMSCRVMGRKAEDEIMASIRDYLMNKGMNTVRASYIKTAKNTPVVELFERLGFIVESGSIHEIGDRKDYVANIDDLPTTTGMFRSITECWA